MNESTAGPDEDEAAKEQRLSQQATNGYHSVIAVAIIDDDSVTQPNVTPLVFAEEQGSFLVGVAAIYKSKSCHIGFVGGVNTPDPEVPGRLRAGC